MSYCIQAWNLRVINVRLKTYQNNSVIDDHLRSFYIDITASSLNYLSLILH